MAVEPLGHLRLDFYLIVVKWLAGAGLMLPRSAQFSNEVAAREIGCREKQKASGLNPLASFKQTFSSYFPVSGRPDTGVMELG